MAIETVPIASTGRGPQRSMLRPTMRCTAALTRKNSVIADATSATAQRCAVVTAWR